MEQSKDPHARSALSFAQVLSEAIAAQHLTLERLQVRLRRAGTPVSSATLSYWQTGRSVPTRRGSMRAVRELEQILSLPPGHLAGALPPELAGADNAASHLDGLLPVTQLASDLLATLGLDLGRNFTGLVDHTHAVIGVAGQEQQQHTLQVLRSTNGGLHHLPVVVYQDGDEPCEPRVEASGGCRLGRVTGVPEARLLVAELLLPRPLARGELHQLSYTIHWAPTTARSFRLERVLLNRHQVFSASVEYLGDPPRTARAYHRPDAPAPAPNPPQDGQVSSQPLSVDDHQLQSIVLEAQPGVHGIAWDW